MMLKKRNASVHIYVEETADELLLLIGDSFAAAFEALKKLLREKIND